MRTASSDSEVKRTISPARLIFAGAFGYPVEAGSPSIFVKLSCTSFSRIGSSGTYYIQLGCLYVFQPPPPKGTKTTSSRWQLSFRNRFQAYLIIDYLVTNSNNPLLTDIVTWHYRNRFVFLIRRPLSLFSVITRTRGFPVGSRCWHLGPSYFGHAIRPYARNS